MNVTNVPLIVRLRAQDILVNSGYILEMDIITFNSTVSSKALSFLSL